VKLRKGAKPAQVTYIGHDSSSDRWVGMDEIRSKALKEAAASAEAAAAPAKGKGKGKGKGKEENPLVRKNLDKLGKIEAERKVWVGGLKKETKRGELFKHFKEHAKPHLFEIMPKGTACVAFKTAEDAQTAIDILNNSELDGKEIQVDVWTQKEKKERPEGEKKERRPKVKKSLLKTSFVKGGQVKVDSKMKLKLKEVDHSLKAWVGGLSEKTTWKKLKEHFKEMGCEVDLCDLMKKGTACVTFKAEDDVSSAVAVVNGTELDESTLTVDVWTKPERKEKPEKVKAEKA